MRRGELVALLGDYVARQRELDRIRELVLEGFALDDSSQVKRSEVYAFVARRMRKAVSNQLCVAVWTAIAALPVLEANGGLGSTA